MIENGRRRPMRRLGDLLPDTASRLGIEGALEEALAMAAWDRVVAEQVPAAAGQSRLIGRRADALLVTAPSSTMAAELRLRASGLLAAMAADPHGVRARELLISIRQPEDRAGSRSTPGGPGGPIASRLDTVRSKSQGRPRRRDGSPFGPV